MNDNIQFHIDLAEDGNGLRCGSANIFSGWVANKDDANPIESVHFVVNGKHLGTLEVKQERPDLVKMFGKSMLGFTGAIMIPEDCKNSTLAIVAAGKIGTQDLIASYPLKLSVQADEIEFKKRERIPDDMLRHLVVQNLDPHRFLENGKRSVEVIKEVLAKNSIEYRSLNNILDFGVGCGRIMRWWEDDAETISIWGTDINAELIAWCRENLPFAKFSLNALNPPMTFDNESFDFLYAFSVFTHLGLETQKKWLAEFARVLTPGGAALISVHGDEDARSLDADEREVYTNKGFLMRTMNAEGENMCAVYQNQPVTEQLFGEKFKVIDFLPGARPSTSKQDLYLIRKR